ncbi:hypothetical protein [Alkalicoccus urumqiensis]|uniref:Uncharacterized protein n=1 Tax=Alkalicoccus urumqiensis TaxID=1548213 RepID=A0A2P6MHZ0_ALKUR|nr:hypothetical protein [Alkalicoccus urumqiensis]PRO65863.1 hypothetical protein C6I21_08180 [Alkalicoccus urumqiensis]
MSKNSEEVKIAEKVKFWEEQDQINKELIPRVVKNHEMITDLTYQSEKHLTQLASMQDETENNKSIIETIDTKVNEMQVEIVNIKEELLIEKQKKQELISSLDQSEIQIKELNQRIEELKGGSEKNNNLILIIGVIAALIISIAGIIF